MLRIADEALPAEVTESVLINVDALRVGMFIQLEVGWIHHPFPMSSFRISSPEQIHVLQELGVKSVRYIPAKSSPSHQDIPLSSRPEAPDHGQRVAPTVSADRRPAGGGTHFRSSQGFAVQRCSQRYQEAASAYSSVTDEVHHAPQRARHHAETLVQSCVDELHERGQCAVRLLAHSLGNRPAAHAVNVMVLALLLGQALGMSDQGLRGLGMAALLHDLGKSSLPPHIGESGAPLTDLDLQRYREHVGLSVELAQRMELHSDVLISIAQHHEMADGSGFPLHLVGDDLSRSGQILALTNRYDRLCNPLHGEPAVTPHEALSQLFALQRDCFDVTVLAAFIRMMGVYPPGSLVQLADGRYAVVVQVDAAAPLRPCVLLYAPGIPRDEAALLDLSASPDPGILRSLKPAQLPRDALDYLLPQPRICYFFERAANPQSAKERA